MAPGSVVGHMVAHDADQEGTLNSQLTYTILSETPPSDAHAFSIDAASGTIQALRSLQRKEHQLYNLMIRVSDPGNTHTHAHTRCTIKASPDFKPQISSDRVQHRLSGHHQNHRRQQRVA